MYHAFGIISKKELPNTIRLQKVLSYVFCLEVLEFWIYI